MPSVSRSLLEIGYTFDALPSVVDGFERAPAVMRDRLNEAVGLAVSKIIESVQDEPPPGERHLQGPLPGGFYSDRQRRWFFAALRGGMTLPYQRTGQHRASWQNLIETTPNTISGHVWSADPVGEFLYGTAFRNQARMFEGIWPTRDELMERITPAVDDLMDQAIDRTIADILTMIGV